MNLKLSDALPDGAIAIGFWLVLLLVIAGTLVLLTVRIVRDLVSALRAKAKSRRERT